MWVLEVTIDRGNINEGHKVEKINKTANTPGALYKLLGQILVKENVLEYHVHQ